MVAKDEAEGVRNDDFWADECERIIDQSQQVVARGEAVFFDPTNSVEFSAARMAILDLDVAADMLSDDFKQARPMVPWALLALTRDKFAHHHEDINRDLVWNLIVARLPKFAAVLRKHG